MDSEISVWKERYAAALQSMASEHLAMDRRDALYAGTHSVLGANTKDSANVRNIVYELIESEVDSTVPVAQVNARRACDEDMAHIAQELLRSETSRLAFAELNDAAERMTTVQGSCGFLVEWRPSREIRGSTGHLALSLVHPRQILVQPGSADIESAAWIILSLNKTQSELKARYADYVATEINAEDIELVHIGYYRNKDGGIGRCVWVNDTMLESMDNYELPQVAYCEKCAQMYSGTRCPVCKAKLKRRESEVLMHEVMTGQGLIKKGVSLPIYTPRVYPLILRKNVSIHASIYGQSDVDKIQDQQETIKKLGSKIDEKVLKGGSYVTLPTGVGIETSDRELKILRVKSPADKAMIDVYNVQPDISKDRAVLEENYQWAKSTLGITDSFQGKHDTTATSGVAKKFSVGQAAGRLESKRVMKSAAYAHLFELMFRFLLAYSDDEYPLATRGAMGEIEYKSFCRHSFLNKDALGKWYWNDDFTFGVDAAGALAANRQAMWQETRENFSMGSFGVPTQITAQLAYWRVMESLNYPLAGMVRAQLENAVTAQPSDEILLQEEE